MATKLERIPLLGDGTLPPLILLIRWLGRLQQQGVTEVSLERLPPGNGSIPDILQLGGIKSLILENSPSSEPFLWEGCAGSRVQVGTPTEASSPPLHHGHLPVDSAGTEFVSWAIIGLIDLARLEDANSLLSGGAGASWEHILAAAGMGQAPRIPPLATHATTVHSGRLGAWNPLPFARPVTVALPQPPGPAPWALVNPVGARFQVQVVEGPVGRELLSAMSLNALECVSFTNADDPVPGSHWEVSRMVLDNGRVRVELDPLGQVVRLCFAGHFTALSGPALHAQIDGLPFSGASTTTILEEGPVRARIAVTRTGALGTLHLIYTLHAHEDMLRISASWDGQSELILDHPTAHRGAIMRCAGELAFWQNEQAHSVMREWTMPQHGLRWAMLAEPTGDGIALAAARPLTVSADGGHLRVHLERSTSYAICGVHDGTAMGCLPRTSLSLAVPGRSFSGEAAPAGSEPLRVDERLVCWWLSRPDDWRGEMLISEWQGCRTAATLMRQGGPGSAREAWRVAASGATIAQLTATPEGDGFELELEPFEVVIIRWR